jgi:NitT/TauT family transport system ATP-binding protein
MMADHIGKLIDVIEPHDDHETAIELWTCRRNRVTRRLAEIEVEREERRNETIVFVTHGIAEAVFLGTRVVVLTAGPARMADNIKIELPAPRTLDVKTSEAFGEYSRRIYHLLGL